MLLLLLWTLVPHCWCGLAPGVKHAFGFDAVAPRYLEQKQDHFSGDNQKTWQQAYFVNADHWDGSAEAPVFLYIGGEGPLGSGGSVESNFITDVLPKYKGLLLALEHRYYGCHNTSSCPYNVADPEPNHLQFCTSTQALADLGSFHAYATLHFKVPAAARWIAIGGSYPGMLAGFVRAVYPDLFFAAVASSAPITGVLDMQSFQNVVTDAYAMSVEGVQGSPECSQIIAAGHHLVGSALLTAAGRSQLAFFFNASVPNADWLLDPTNQRTFAGCGVATFPAQSNVPTCTGAGCGISQICSILTDPNSGKDALERLATLAAAQQSQKLQMTHHCEMDWEMPGDVPPAVENYWGYQTCNEFGFYQTCEAGTDCFYTQGLVDFTNVHHRPDDFCEQFSISRDETQERIQATNNFYNAHLYNATRIVWVNGDVDPWHQQSVLKAPSPEQPVIFPVVGARHCAWMRAQQQEDQQSLKDARLAIFQQLDRWLQPSD